jgi:selenocysteine lyase/cysteine desulfurase
MKQLFGELPGRETLKNEFIMQSVQASHYDYQYFQGGGRLVWVGYPFGVELQMIEDAVSEKTAGLVYVHSYHNGPRQVSFEETLKIGHKYNLPTIVDNASVLLPKRMLHHFVELGADLVTMSGGKVLRAPNSTGIVLGGGKRGKELIEAIRMQAFPHIWGIGRPFKVSKENIVGLVKALELFVSWDEDQVYASQMAKAEYIKDQLASIPKLDVTIIPNDDRHFEHPISARVPKVYMEWDMETFGFDTKGLDQRMAAEDPPISLRSPRLTQSNTINRRCIRLVDPYMLRGGEEVIVATRIRKAFLGE